jgi:hypothetical protein
MKKWLVVIGLIGACLLQGCDDGNLSSIGVFYKNGKPCRDLHDSWGRVVGTACADD